MRRRLTFLLRESGSVHCNWQAGAANPGACRLSAVGFPRKAYYTGMLLITKSVLDYDYKLRDRVARCPRSAPMKAKTLLLPWFSSNQRTPKYCSLNFDFVARIVWGKAASRHTCLPNKQTHHFFSQPLPDPAKRSRLVCCFHTSANRGV